MTVSLLYLATRIEVTRSIKVLVNKNYYRQQSRPSATRQPNHHR